MTCLSGFHLPRVPEHRATAAANRADPDRRHRGTACCPETSLKESVATSRLPFDRQFLRIISTLCPSVDKLQEMTQPRRICVT
jgi:hypothetical protein